MGRKLMSYERAVGRSKRIRLALVVNLPMSGLAGAIAATIGMADTNPYAND